MVRGGVLRVRGAGIERKPLQENDSPGGRRRRRIPERATCRENQSPGGPGSYRQRSTPGGRTRAGARLGGRNPCDARKEAIPPQPARHRQPGKPLCRSPAPRAMSLPRKAETHATTTRKTPPARKTPVGARPPRAMSLPRKAETHATTTRRTPPNRKTPVGARPSGRCRCQDVCGRRTQDARWWSGLRITARSGGWAPPGGAGCKGSKRNP